MDERKGSTIIHEKASENIETATFNCGGFFMRTNYLLGKN